MRNSAKPPVRRDTHVYMDEKTWNQLESIAIAEDRSVTSTIRVLLKEAMESRGNQSTSL